MKKVFVLLILGLNLLPSCKFEKKRISIDKMIEESLKRDNYIIPDSLFSFFPDISGRDKHLKVGAVSDNAEKSEIPLRIKKFSPVRLIEAYESKDKELLRNLIENYRSQALSTVKSENSDYFVLGRERELMQRYDTLSLKEKYSNLNEDLLVFNFAEFVYDIPFLYDSTTISRLPSGYEILILKSGDKFVLPEKRYYEWDILPDNLKHGYKSGVAFKEDEIYIIYWTMAW